MIPALVRMAPLQWPAVQLSERSLNGKGLGMADGPLISRANLRKTASRLGPGRGHSGLVGTANRTSEGQERYHCAGRLHKLLQLGKKYKDFHGSSNPMASAGALSNSDDPSGAQPSTRPVLRGPHACPYSTGHRPISHGHRRAHNTAGFMFGAICPLAPWLTKRLGAERTLGLSLLILGSALVLRAPLCSTLARYWSALQLVSPVHCCPPWSSDNSRKGPI